MDFTVTFETLFTKTSLIWASFYFKTDGEKIEKR